MLQLRIIIAMAINEKQKFTFQIYSEVAKSCRRIPQKEPFAIEHYT